MKRRARLIGDAAPEIFRSKNRDSSVNPPARRPANRINYRRLCVYVRKDELMDDSVRWSLKVSRETDEALRAYLGETGARKGDLSKFVQDAVRARLQAERRTKGAGRRAAPERAQLAEALEQIRSQTRKLSRARFEKLVAEAVAFARRHR